MTALALEEVCGGYGRTEVLRNVTLTVGEGEIVTILGANGAGKSTLLNGIVGLLPRKTGQLTFRGRSIGELRTEQIVRLGICLVPERRQLFGTMTVAGEPADWCVRVHVASAEPASPGRAVRSFSDPPGAAAATGADHERRSAADVGYRPRPDVGAQAAFAR